MEVNVVKHICEIMDVKESEIKNLKRFAKGMSNYTYFFQIDDLGYVIRFLGVDANKFVDRIDELNAITVMQSANLTTELVYFDLETGIKISKYAYGLEFDFEKNNDSDLKILINALKEMHNIKKEIINDYELIKRLNKYQSYLEDSELSEKFFFLKNWFIKTYIEKYKNTKKVFCHNDLQTSNIIIHDNEIKFIDLEFAAYNDLFYDIAGFEEEAYLVCEHYFNRKLDNEMKNHIDIYKIYQSIQWYLVALYKEKIGFSELTNYDFLDLANYFINKATELYDNIVKRG